MVLVRNAIRLATATDAQFMTIPLQGYFAHCVQRMVINMPNKVNTLF